MILVKINDWPQECLSGTQNGYTHRGNYFSLPERGIACRCRSDADSYNPDDLRPMVACQSSPIPHTTSSGGACHLDALLRFLSLPAQLLSRCPGLRPLVKACSTTVGQKLLMAVSGLSLCGFLVAHLAGNLKLYAGEQSFNDYAHALHGLGPVLAAAEIGLFAVFLLHIGLAISLASMNKIARGRDYFMKETKQGIFILPNGASSWMMVTGLIILFFLVTHVIDMKLKVGPFVDYTPALNEEKVAENEFLAVRAVLSTPSRILIYIVSLVALGIHLSHGVRSALQTLGMFHKRWNLILNVIGMLFAWGIAAGFISLVVWAMAAKG
jgi:succinate dehydrogenase / fumarate reductase cytochrome b subunit